MLVARVLEILAALFLIAQIILPLIRGTPLFPVFRRPAERQLLTRISHSRQDLIEDELDEEARRLNAEHAIRAKTKQEFEAEAFESKSPTGETTNYADVIAVSEGEPVAGLDRVEGQLGSETDHRSGVVHHSSDHGV